MLSISGRYELVKSDNFAAYLVGLGFPEDRAKIIESWKMVYVIKHDGDKITLDVEGKPDVHREYIVNKEVDEKAPHDVVLKTTATIEVNAVVLRSKTPKGRLETRTHTFSDTGVVLVYTSDDPKVPSATRTFKRL